MADMRFPNAPPPPPMVSAPGMVQPAQQPNPMADVLRGKVTQDKRAERSRRGQERWQGLADQFGPGVTQGPVQNVDWGNIIGKGVSSYMAAKEGKEADTAEDSAAQLQQEFFNSVTKDDPQGSKLVMMAQAGIPGSDQALSEYLNPKKEALAGLIQGITSGQLSPEMAAELAPRYGMTPEMASKAAAYAAKRLADQQAAESDERKELATLGVQGRLDAAQIAADARGSKGGPGGAVPAGTQNLRNKALFDLDTNLQQVQATDYKFDDLLARLQADPTAFSDNWAIKEAVSGSGIPGISQIADRMMGPNQILLRNLMMDETLNKLASMSGAVSNYEMQQIKSSLPSAILNRETAIEMVKKLNEWRKAAIGATKLKRMYLQTYGFTDDRAQEMDFYTMAKQGVTPEQFGAQLEAQKATRSAPATAPGRGQELIDQFESEAAEMGF